MTDPSPEISIIIPNLNSPIIDRTLAAIHQQDFDLAQVEVLVVGLDEPGLVREDDLVRLIRTNGPATPAQARNIGLRQARGQLLCLTDADCLPYPEWLAELTGPFAEDDVMVAGGGITFRAEGYWTLADNVSWFYPYLAYGDRGARPLLPSLNMCLRRQIVDEIGLFDERYPKAAGEDAEWTTRMRQAGHTLHFLPLAVIRHEPNRSTFRSTMGHAYAYGRYSVKIHPDFIDFLETPAYLTRWWSVLALSPAMAAWITARAILVKRPLWRYWYTAPAVFLSKVAWCFGLAKSLHLKGNAG
jgi:glycosyltransferase involved in cell wall biosynthesis